MTHLWGTFIQELNLYQKNLNATIASAFRGLDEQGLYGALVIIGIAFVYGVIHAVGPGHGKAVVASYFLSQGKHRREAFKIGYLVAIFHGLSALLLTFGIYYLIDGLFSRTFNQSVEVLYKVSGGMILLVGCYLLYEFFHTAKHTDSPAPLSSKKPYAVALSIGIVPCPGVMTVVLFSLMLGHLFVGILAALAMSIGMGLTISLAGIMAAQGSCLVHTKGRAFQRILQALSVVLVFGIGVFLLFLS